MTHQAPANRFSLFSRMVYPFHVVYFVFVTDGLTHTMCKYNDHLFGLGLVDQKICSLNFWSFSLKPILVVAVGNQTS